MRKGRLRVNGDRRNPALGLPFRKRGKHVVATDRDLEAAAFTEMRHRLQDRAIALGMGKHPAKCSSIPHLKKWIAQQEAAQKPQIDHHDAALEALTK